MITAFIFIILVLLYWPISNYLLDLSNLSKSFLLKHLIAFWLAACLSSLLFFIAVVSSGNHMLFQTIQIFIIPLSLFLIRKSADTYYIQMKRFLSDRLTTVQLLLLLCFIMLMWQKSSWGGGWDSKAIWNMHSRFLWAGWGLENMKSTAHPDYPLLLSSTVALLNYFSDYFDLTYAFLVNNLIGISVLILLTEIAKLRNNLIMLLFSGTFLFSMPEFSWLLALQYADILQGLFFSFSILFLIQYLNNEKDEIFYVYLFFLVFSCWVKNEGLIFLGLNFAFWVYYAIKNQRFIKFTLVAVISILVFSLLTWYKIYFGFENDMAQVSLTQIKSFLMERSRYIITLEYFKAIVVTNFIPGFLTILVSPFFYGFKTAHHRMVYFMLLGLLICYLGIYIITINELTWHIRTSMSRLIIQFLLPTITAVFLLPNNLIIKQDHYKIK